MKKRQLPGAWLAAVLDSDGKPVGLGVLVKSGQLITCAHVVARALGLPDDHPSHPKRTASLFSFAFSKKTSARVTRWYPVSHQSFAPHQDICVLDLEEPELALATWDDLLAQEPREDHRVHALGCPVSAPQGVYSRGHVLVGEVANGWWQLDPPPSSTSGHVPIDHGFSGSLAWDMDEDKPVGIIVAKSKTTTFVIPCALLRAACGLREDNTATGVIKSSGGHAGQVVSAEAANPHDVFLCHSSKDKNLVRELAAALRARGFRVWLDEWELQPGRPWQEALERAIQSVRSAAVLYGPAGIGPWADRELRAFLNEFVRRGLPVIPVLLPGAPEAPELPLFLREFTWVDLRPGFSEAGLKRLAWGIGDDAGPAHEPPPANQASARLFKLWNVPPLPLEHIPRPELEALKTELVSTDPRPLALMGQRVRFAVQGMGGIGKSVLAAALCREPEVRRAFPDGVFWLTLGQTPDTLGLQADLAQAFGHSGGFETTEQGKRHLAELLSERACLLVLDDVWQSAHAEPFNAVGERGKLLLTTRKEDVSQTLCAEIRSLAELPERQAFELFAAWAHVDGSELSPDKVRVARAIVAECGELPLALALTGARLRRRSFDRWQTELTRLRQADVAQLRAKLPDYPHESLLVALELSVQDLPEPERERYLQLAVFPEDVAIPEPVLATYWGGLGKAAVQATVDRFIDSSLARHNAAGRVFLHDLLRDYVRARSGSLRALDQKLVDAYARAAPDGWYTAPNDGYFYEYFAHHLSAAQGVTALRRLLFDLPWLAAKLAATDSHALISDFTRLDLPRDEAARMLQSALRLSAHVLDSHPDELLGQVMSRLLGEPAPDLQTVVRSAEKLLPAPALVPRWPALTPPGGPLLRSFEGHQGWVYSVSFSPDRRFALSASHDKTLKLWDADSGKLLRSFEGHQRGVLSVSFSPDGRFALSASADNTLKLWQVDSGKLLRSFEGHQRGVTSVSFSPDGRFALSASADNTLKLWQVDSGKLLRSFESHRGATSVSFSPDGRFALAGSYDKTLKLWEVDSGKLLRSFEGHQSGVTSVSFSPDRRFALSGSDDKTLKLWEVDSGKLLRSFEGHQSGVTSVSFSPDGRFALSGSRDKTLKLWQVDSGKLLRSFGGHQDWILSVSFSPDGRFALSGSRDKTLKLWQVDSDKLLRPVEGHQCEVYSVSFSPDGLFALSGSGDKTLKLWQVDSGKLLRSFEDHQGAVTSVSFSSAARFALSGSSDRTLKLWEVDSGRLLRSFEGHQDVVTSVSFSPDGRFALSGSGDRTLKLWQIDSGKLLRSFGNGQDWALSVSFSPDGRFALSASYDKTLKLWEVDSGKLLRSFGGHQDWALSASFSPDGRVALSASYDKTLKLWQVDSGRLLRSFEGHQREVTSVSFSPDGRFALSASGDKTLKLWQVDSGRPVASFSGDAAFPCVSFAPNSRGCVAGDALGRLHLFEVRV